MTKEMGQMTKEVSREVMAMMEELSHQEIVPLDPEKEFTLAMYCEFLREKQGIEICKRAVAYRLNYLVSKGALISRDVNYDGKRCKAYSRP